MPIKNSKLEINKNKRKEFEKNPPKISFEQVKQKVDKILETFKKRVTYKKNYYRSFHRKEVENRFNKNDINKSFFDLLDYCKILNLNIVSNFVDKMEKNDDLKKALMEAETGFNQQINVMDVSTRIFNSVYKFIDKLFGNEWKDLKFKLEDKGYFTEIYNDYINIKEPTINDLESLKNKILLRINETCDYIEKTLNSEIEKVKQKLTIEKIKQILDIDVSKL